MKKCYLKFFIFAYLLPFTAFSQTVHTTSDTCYNSDLSIAYYIDATVVSEPGKNTVTFTFSEGTSALGEIFDFAIYRDVDARFKDRPRIAKSVQVPANGVFVFEDEHETWADDGGGLYGYTGSGTLPANVPMFYSIAISRLDDFGGTTRPRRSYPAIHLPDAPTAVVRDEINSDMTLITQVFPIEEDSTVILKLDFAPDYSYYQRVLAEALPNEPLYPAGDKLVFFGKVYMNNVPDPAGRTDLGYGNLYWGHEGSAYAKVKVSPDLIGADGKAYIWLTSGRPGHSTVEPIPVEMDFPTGGGGQTVHTTSDTCYNSDLSIAYYIDATVVSEAGKNTVTFTFSEGTSALGEIFDFAIYRDVDARFKDRPRIAKSVQVPANGVFVFEDEHETWADDGGGLYGYTGSGTLPANVPMFYSIAISRLDDFGGTTRPRRSYPAIYLPDPPTAVVRDEINSDMTLITQVFPIEEDTTVILKLDFAPDYTYYQRVLAEALPNEPLYPAGDKLVFFGKVYMNNVPDPAGRTDLGYGNLYWGHEGSAYAKVKVSPDLIGADGKAYIWLTSGRPGHSTVEPIPVEMNLPTTGGQTVHTTIDTSYNSDLSIAYFINATVVSEAGKNTVTFTFSEGTSALGEIFDFAIYRDVDARFKDRPRIAKSVQVPANGVFVFEDEHETWADDGGGLYGYTGSGTLPANVPMFYSIAISRLDDFGGTTRPRRSYPAIYLPDAPKDVVQDVINDDMTLVTQVFPNPDDTTAILKLDFAPDYTYYQQVLAEALPNEPLYPAGDKLVFFGKVYLNNMADPTGRTDIGYGNLYWGHEGSTYAKISVDEQHIGSDGKTYVWLTSGRPGHSTVVPIPVDFGFIGVNTEETNNWDLNVYPNPTSGLINIELNQDIERINVYDLTGKAVFTKTLDAPSLFETIDLSGQTNGVYFLQIQNKNSFITKKIILE